MRRISTSPCVQALALVCLLFYLDAAQSVDAAEVQVLDEEPTDHHTIRTVLFKASKMLSSRSKAPQTRHSIEKSLAKADEEATHISKGALRREMRKLEPGFDKKMAAEQSDALPFAVKQSSGPQLGATAKLRARRQATPFVPSLASDAEAKKSSDQSSLSFADKKQAAAQAAPQSEQEVEKGFESTLSASDEAATHVSKKELQEMMDRLSAGMQTIKTQPVHVEVPVSQRRIPSANTLKFAQHQAGNGLLSPSLAQAASNQAQPLAVQTTAAASQARAPILSSRANALAQSQASEAMSPSALSTAKQQAATPFVLTTGSELQAAHQTSQEIGASDRARAKFQAQSWQLHGAERKQAEFQGSQDSLPLINKKLARRQANAPHFDHSSREQAKQQAQMASMSKGRAREAQMQSNDLPLRTKDEMDAFRQASQKLRAQTEVTAREQANGLNLRKSQAKAAAELAQAAYDPSALGTAAHQAKSSPMSQTKALAAQRQAASPVLTSVEQGASVLQALAPALPLSKERFAIRQQENLGLSAQEMRQAYRQSRVGSKMLIHKDLGEASHQAHADGMTTDERLYASQQSHADHDAGTAAAAAAQARQVLNGKDQKAAASQASQVMSFQNQETAFRQADDHLSSRKEMGAMVQATDPEMSSSENMAAQKQATGARYESKVQQEALAQAKDTPSVQEMLTAADQAENKIRKSDQLQAQRQVREESISKADQIGAWKQAQVPQASVAISKQAELQAAAPDSNPQSFRFAKHQAQGAEYDTRTAVKAWQQSSNRLHKADAAKAKEQAQLADATRNMALAKKQADQMFGAASKQAIDTDSHLTIKKRLEALKQTDDALKHKDAKVASKQALPLKLTATDSQFSKNQIFDSKISRLRKQEERYAAQQVKSHFAGDMNDQDRQLAQKQADKAETKHQSFLHGYAAWKEKKRREAIKAKYALKMKKLLRTRDSRAQADLGEGEGTSRQRVVPKQHKVIEWNKFYKSLKRIRAHASDAIHQVHALSLQNQGNLPDSAK